MTTDAFEQQQENIFGNKYPGLNRTVESASTRGLKKYNAFELKMQEMNSEIQYLNQAIDSEQQKHHNISELEAQKTKDMLLM